MAVQLGTAEVLDSEPRRTAPRTLVLVGLAAALVVVGLVAGVLLGPRWRHATRTFPAAGTFVLDFTAGSGAVLSGPLALTIPHEVLTASAWLETSGSLIPDVGGPTVVHDWGTAHLTLRGSPCQGPVAWSYYYGTREGFGAINLYCRDGSALGGRLRLTDYQEPRPEHQLWRITLHLDQAYYVARR